MFGRFLRNFSGDENSSRAAMKVDLIELTRREARVCDDRPSIELAAGKHEGGERHGILTGQDRAISGPDFEARQIRSNGIHRVRESAIAPRTIAFHEGRMVRLLLDMRTDDLVHPVREPCENVRRGQCIDHFRQSVLPDPAGAGRDLRPVIFAVRLPHSGWPRQLLLPRRAVDPCRRTFPRRRRKSASRTRRDQRRPASARSGGS